MPVWIQALQALLTVAIALGVGVIALFQWRTAHAKINIDLFDRRYAVYREAADATRLIVQHGKCHDTEAFPKMLKAWGESRFLFGKEVSHHLDALLNIMINMQAAELEMTGELTPEQRKASTKVKWDGVKAFLKEQKILNSVFEPYMLMDAKRPKTLSEWLSERNRIRLSYADEKQK